MTELAEIDPRGLIADAYAIEGISAPECRSIFLDWAIGLPTDQNSREAIGVLIEVYSPSEPNHPMTAVLHEGLAEQPAARRRGGRRGRSTG